MEACINFSETFEDFGGLSENWNRKVKRAKEDLYISIDKFMEWMN